MGKNNLRNVRVRNQMRYEWNKKGYRRFIFNPIFVNCGYEQRKVPRKML